MRFIPPKWDIELLLEPFHRVEIRWAVVTSHRIQQVIQDAHANPTAPFTHRRNHAPLVGLWIISLNARNGVSAAPTANYTTRQQDQRRVQNLIRTEILTRGINLLIRSEVHTVLWNLE